MSGPGAPKLAGSTTSFESHKFQNLTPQKANLQATRLCQPSPNMRNIELVNTLIKNTTFNLSMPEQAKNSQNFFDDETMADATMARFPNVSLCLAFAVRSLVVEASKPGSRAPSKVAGWFDFQLLNAG